VIDVAKTQAVGGHFEATLKTSIRMNDPGWFALRTPPPSVPKDPELQKKTPLNELGREVFSHTSAIYVDMAGRKRFDRAVAAELLAGMRESVDFITANGNYADEQERQRVLDVYRDGIAEMERRLKN
jgi:hypothetical protein